MANNAAGNGGNQPNSEAIFKYVVEEILGFESPSIFKDYCDTEGHECVDDLLNIHVFDDVNNLTYMDKRKEVKLYSRGRHAIIKLRAFYDYRKDNANPIND